MVRFSDNDGCPALTGCLFHQPVDPQHMGTGGIHDLCAPLLQHPQSLPCLAVGTDDHRLSRPHLLRAVRLPRTQRLQRCDDPVIVYDTAQHNAAAFPGSHLRHVHGPFHAVAEPRRLRQYHLHSIPPRA